MQSNYDNCASSAVGLHNKHDRFNKHLFIYLFIYFFFSDHVSKAVAYKFWGENFIQQTFKIQLKNNENDDFLSIIHTDYFLKWRLSCIKLHTSTEISIAIFFHHENMPI